MRCISDCAQGTAELGRDLLGDLALHGKEVPVGRSQRLDQTWRPVAASMSWAAMRTKAPRLKLVCGFGSNYGYGSVKAFRPPKAWTRRRAATSALASARSAMVLWSNIVGASYWERGGVTSPISAREVVRNW